MPSTPPATAAPLDGTAQSAGTTTTSWDAIVIGSGIGGMTAAGLLAAVDGRRVLVLEKHTEPGGLTHVFRRDGAAWDVGLHYVGRMAPGSQLRSLFDYLSGVGLRWNRFPDAFDRFVDPGLEFSVPSDRKRYRRRLLERFPDEAAAIRRYFRDIGRAAFAAKIGVAGPTLPAAIARSISA